VKKTAAILALAAAGAAGAAGMGHAQTRPVISPLPSGLVGLPGSALVTTPQRSIGPIGVPTTVIPASGSAQRRIMQLNPTLSLQPGSPFRTNLPVTPGLNTLPMNPALTNPLVNPALANPLVNPALANPLVNPGFTNPFVTTPVVSGFGPTVGGVPNAGMTLGPLNAVGTTGAPGSYGASMTGAGQRGAQRSQGTATAQPAANAGMGAVQTANARRHMVRGAMEVATAQRFNAARNQGSLRSGQVVRTTSAYVWVKVNDNGTRAIRQVPSSDVFFYRAGELLDGANFPSMAQPGETVMIIDSSHTAL